MPGQQGSGLLDPFNVEFESHECWATASVTHRGCVRPHNEDAFIAIPALNTWAVADGMGGHDAGDVASRIIVELIQAGKNLNEWMDQVDQIEGLIGKAHEKIRLYAKEECNGHTVGSTIVAAVTNFVAGKGIVLWAGDSRLYRMRGGKLEQITRDHSQLNEMVDRGLLTQEEAEARGGGNVITRAVGAAQELYLEAGLFDIQIHDTFLLCSDGLYGALEGEAIAQIMREFKGSVSECATALMNDALESGARDNVTVIILEPISSAFNEE